jgi:hypothetical protein
MGKDNIIPLARRRLKDRDTKALDHLVLSVDRDTRADGGPTPGGTTIGMASVRQLAKELDPGCSHAAQTVALFDKSVQIHLAQWGCDDGQLTDGVPVTHTLERMLSASIAAAHPNRPQAVKQWLESRPLPPPESAKEFAFSYLAGWYATCGGCEGFCEQLWREAGVREELQARLRRVGIWSIAEVLADAPCSTNVVAPMRTKPTDA